MIRKYITATILALASGNSMYSQVIMPKPRLVINIAIDQLRSDYIEAISPRYGENGFKKLYKTGVVYTDAHYSFSPIDRASAITAIATGTSPYNNSITGFQWLDKSTLIPVCCIDDKSSEGIFTNESSSPKNIATSTINDELKVTTDGNAIVYSIATQRDAAILAGGHAADGAIWYNEDNKCWCSSKYYFKKAPKWLESYNLLNVKEFSNNDANSNITNIALQCINANNMGMDDIPDMLSLTYDATITYDNDKNSQLQIVNTYVQLDKELDKLTTAIEQKVGKGNVLFIITSTGYSNLKEYDYAKFNVPSKTLYINRTAKLLNMYLGAIYGMDNYVESCFYNQIFLNIPQIDQKKLSLSEILTRAQTFLIQIAGVKNVYTSKDLLILLDNGSSTLRNWYNADRCGDLILEVTPGWKLLNEDNLQQYTSRETLTTFPIIFYGGGILGKSINTPVTTDRIAPTIAKAIRIRAPNGCSKSPLDY